MVQQELQVGTQQTHPTTQPKRSLRYGYRIKHPSCSIEQLDQIYQGPDSTWVEKFMNKQVVNKQMQLVLESL